MSLERALLFVLEFYGGVSLFNDLAAWIRGRSVVEIPKTDPERRPPETSEILADLRRDGRRR